MRIITANLNGVRSAEKKGFFDWFTTQDTDILCVQELKAHAHQLPATATPDGYQGFFHFAERPGYSGTGLYTRHVPEHVQIGLSSAGGTRWHDVDTEGRYVQVDFGRLSVISVYFPSGSSSAVRQARKMAFLEHFLPFITALRDSGCEIILCGDINIAHRPMDLKNWRGNRKNSGFLPEERAWMDRWLAAGFVDVFRALHPTQAAYTWWSNRGQAREKDVGWRIDYQIATPAVARLAGDASILNRHVRFSDHSPLSVEYDTDLRSWLSAAAKYAKK